MDVNSELKDAQLEILDSDKVHSSNTKGMIWFNRVSDKIKAMYNGVIETLATEGYVDSAINNSESTLGDGGLVTAEQSVDPSAPPAGYRRIFAKDDGLYQQNDSGDISLAGLINTISSPQTFTKLYSSALYGTTGSQSDTIFTATEPTIVFMYNVPFKAFPGGSSYTWYALNRDEATPITNGTDDYVKGRTVFLETGDSLRFFFGWGNVSFAQTITIKWRTATINNIDNP